MKFGIFISAFFLHLSSGCTFGDNVTVCAEIVIQISVYPPGQNSYIINYQTASYVM